jgi:hypothetical protein
VLIIVKTSCIVHGGDNDLFEGLGENFLKG